MTLYKIRDKGTGLFSTGGAYVKWHTKGKEWRTLGHLRAHLTMIKDSLDSFRKYNKNPTQWVGPYTNAEIVVFELVEQYKEDVVVL